MTAFTQLVVNQNTRIFFLVLLTHSVLSHLILKGVKYSSLEQESEIQGSIPAMTLTRWEALDKVLNPSEHQVPGLQSKNNNNTHLGCWEE